MAMMFGMNPMMGMAQLGLMTGMAIGSTMAQQAQGYQSSPFGCSDMASLSPSANSYMAGSQNTMQMLEMGMMMAMMMEMGGMGGMGGGMGMSPFGMSPFGQSPFGQSPFGMGGFPGCNGGMPGMFPNFGAMFAPNYGSYGNYRPQHQYSGGSSQSCSAGASTATANGPINNPTDFAKQLLGALGAPVTAANVKSLVNWEGREGGNWHNSASFNPLNTTQRMPGSSGMNGEGVQRYSDWNQGLQATVDTLQNGKYNDVLAALKSGNGLGNGSYHGLSTWSGGAYSSI